MTLKRILSIILTINIIAANFSSVVQISAQTEESTFIQAAQGTTLEDDRMQTEARPTEPTEEFVVSSEDDFGKFMTSLELWESNYKITLTCDIDMKGKAFKPIKEFSGIFDGCGHTISNMKIQNKSDKIKNSEIAFINTLNECAEIKNVTLDNYTIEGNSNIKKTAGLVITNHGTISGVDIINSNINNIDKKIKSAGFVLNNKEDGVIKNCFVGMNNKDSNINAGFVGTNFGKITNCSTILSVNSKDVTSGFVNDNFGIIKDSMFKGDVSSRKCAGGFCANNSGEIASCKSEGNVIAKTKSTKVATICGGFIGSNSGVIKDCSSKGTVEGQEFTGGFVGINSDKGELMSCKATCDVKSHTYVASIYCGGFVGLGVGKIENCTFNGTVDGCVDSEKLLGGVIGATVGVISIFSILYMGLIIYCNIESNMFKLGDWDRPINKLISKLTRNWGYFAFDNFYDLFFIVTFKLFGGLQNPIIFKHLHNYIKKKLNIPNDTRPSPLIPIRLGLILIAISVPIEGLIIGLTAGQKYAYVGGFAGCNFGEIIGCRANIDSFKAKTLYNKHNVCGGFVGTNGGTIKDSDATGKEICNKTYTGGHLGGFVGENTGKIENSTTNVSVANGKCTGGFCGSNLGEISGSKSKGSAITNATTVKTKCGGFVGNNDEKGKIYDCTSTGSATGQEYVGGFAGANKSEISGCNAHGKATAKTKANTACAGGFVGKNENGKITTCTATGGAYAKSGLGDAKSGGFVGINKANIIDSKARGYVYLSGGTFYKDDGCGGFVGKNDQGGSIDGCYAECIIETTKKNKGGGFVGEARSESIINNSKCKSKFLTKSGTKNNKRFCQIKDKKAAIENCYAN